uniref:Male-enhanced antigen 1 n=1 Tax=Anopheles atroparvus TaxID=41427 RepID=A0AAG5CW53_ANOAO
MGLPDLPGQPEKEDTFTVDENHTIHVDPFSEDESDNESVGDNHGYEGYQPLNTDELNPSHRRLSVMEENVESGMHVDLNDPAESEPHSGVSLELLNVDVWNAPRPNELNIDIDSTKAAEIVNVMAGIKLPTTAVPDWARGVPEEEWKENLLQRIRQRQQPDVDDGSLKPVAPTPATTNSSSSASSCCQEA